jgi:hypothetical protein
MKFILTIDTEGDNQWDHGRELMVNNIKFIPRFQNLCEKYNMKPTYLVTSEVCADNYARDIFSEYLLKGKAEIGAHLHSWTTPPFLDKDGFRYNDVSHAYASELPEGLLKEKLKNLTRQVEDSFGLSPLSFRSGRYGFNDTLAKILPENSYLVDSSITPYTSWSSDKGLVDGNGGPDFSNKTPFPFKYTFNNSSLIEIPITILPTRFPLNKSEVLAELYFKNVNKNLFLKGVRKLFYTNQPLWLRPLEFMNISLFNEIVDEAYKIKLPFIVMMFHSSELMPGCSQYRTDKDSIERLYDLLERFFILLKSKRITSLTLTEAAQGLNI